MAERFIPGARRRRGKPSEHGTFEVGLGVGSTPRSSDLLSMPDWSRFPFASPGAPPRLTLGSPRPRAEGAAEAQAATAEGVLQPVEEEDAD
ncbi:MAG: hypothetical protein OXH99_07850 [Bryobacterales bacterium]|nr:hypothetical protein [Bryobacterales bacterium]